jgi:hypothetical protein
MTFPVKYEMNENGKDVNQKCNVYCEKLDAMMILRIFFRFHLVGLDVKPPKPTFLQ